MLVSGKESILDDIFRIRCVPQEPESLFVKHRQAARHDAVQFLSTLAKGTAANCWLSFNERCYCRHDMSPLSANPKIFKATQNLQPDRTRFLPGATPGSRHLSEWGLTSLPASKTR